MPCTFARCFEAQRASLGLAVVVALSVVPCSPAEAQPLQPMARRLFEHVRAPGSWRPIDRPLREAPGCGERPDIVEWQVVEPERRWLIARSEGLRLPEAYLLERGSPMQVQGASCWLVTLAETFHTAAENTAAYSALVPSCEPIDGDPPWTHVVREPLAAFHCAGERTFVVFTRHTDGLVLRVDLAEGASGGPSCAALSTVASLIPLNGGDRACAGACEWDDGRYRSHEPHTVFEVRRLAPCGANRYVTFVEVVPAGRDRFQVSIREHEEIREPSGLAESERIDFLGQRLRAHQRMDDGVVVRTAEAERRLRALTRASFVGYTTVTVEGRRPAFERGLRFVEGLTVGPWGADYDFVQLAIVRVSGDSTSRDVARVLTSLALAILALFLGWRVRSGR